MEPEYIIGNEQVLEQMRTGNALPLFDGDVIQFLDAISKKLLKHKLAKTYPDLVTFGFWCRKASVLEMKKSVSWLSGAEEHGAWGRGIVFHVAPSNVAMNFAYSFAAALLAGNRNIVRLPSKMFPQVDGFCDVVKEVLKENSKWQRFVCFVRYGHEKEITDRFSEMSDVRVIWGGDATIREIRKSPLKIRGKEIVFADRYSIALIQAGEYLKLPEGQKKQAARNFYNDTYLMDQNACTSPMLLVWLGEKETVKKAQDLFWDTAYVWIRQKYELQAVQAVKKLQAAYRLAAAVPGTVLVKNNKFSDNRVVRIKVPGLSSELMGYRENSGFFMEYETADLEEILPVLTERCQTISYLGDPLKNELAELVKKHCPPGAERMVPMGKTMDFSLIWDGYDLLREMSREVSV